MPPARAFTRILLNMLIDAAAAALAVPLAWRLAAPALPGLAPGWLWLLGAILLLAGGAPFRLSLQYWRFAGISDLLAVAGSSAVAALLFALLDVKLAINLPSPAFPVIFALTLVLLLAAPRLAYRSAQARSRATSRVSAQPGQENDSQKVLLIGAGDGAELFIRALAQDQPPRYRILGLVSLGGGQTGRRLQGFPILGRAADLAALLDRLAQANDTPALLVITAALSGEELEALLDVADRHGLLVRRVPEPTTLHDAVRAHTPPGARGIAPDTLRPILIEDLLDRAQVPLDRDGMARLIEGRRVLVTGAGGSIGAELSRQLAGFGPAQLLLLDNGEYALWQIDLELAERHPAVPRRAVIADIRDAGRIDEIFASFRPELVFHAAALKHVPMVEANPTEGLLTNALGTSHVADAAERVGAVAMVFISTDKAVNPTSLMGASKRLAEMYCQALDAASRRHGAGLRCVTVRFGNVLGSTGSVVPLFRRQLEHGGPLTVTHPDMQRYFMTVREAVGLVLQASVVDMRAANGALRHEGGVFVLDMGKPVKIVDLARRMIRLAGMQPDRDIEIRYTGLRPGEKLFEELFHGQEPPSPTGYPGLLMAVPRLADRAEVGDAIARIAQECRDGTPDAALRILSGLVPEFER